MKKITYTEALNLMIQKGFEIQGEMGVAPNRYATIAKGDGCEVLEENKLEALSTELEQKEYLKQLGESIEDVFVTADLS
ncbi:hypothetical protein ACOMCU_00410 [Lysinibacillus sp. UGB7]|uniref:hypothetical protein n=1 Tax=Lysinibacillus sp. UGB7 TaxID=3411039 RepID=UPI003B81ABC8